MNEISNELIGESLAPFEIPASDDLCTKVRIYISVLLHWNKRVSLTTVTDPKEILRFHFGESLFASRRVPISDGRLADVGSGAGFPGLPLRMAIPSLNVVLIESNGRKSAFLSEVLRELGLDHVEVFRGRMEDFGQQGSKFDFVTARALGQTDKLLSWSRQQLTPDGKLILWLGSDDCEKISRQRRWNWRHPMHIPGSQRRYLLIGSPGT
jgi:16S rRNA (guanine527-N7)-methyltransferase